MHESSPSLRPGEGFTLVEVVLAVGIIAFVITAIVGLVSVAMRGTKDADGYARLASMHRRVAADLQSQLFSDVTNHFPATNTVLKSYYDYSGTPLTDCYGVSLAANTNAAYYECDVKNVTPTGYSTNARLLKVQILWAYPQFSGTDTAFVSVINYR